IRDFHVTGVQTCALPILSKTYNKVTETLSPRTGDEIYDALFDKRQTDCIKILNFQDQVVPKIDYAIWLHFETCPDELKRILSERSEERRVGKECRYWR